MDFLMDEARQELAGLTRQILAGGHAERLSEVEAAGDRFDTALWADLAAAGMLAAGLPEALGGGRARPARAVLAC